MKGAPRSKSRREDVADGTLTTGEMARLSNTTLRTVRFYEEAGILAPIARTEGGHRVFERPQLERLMLVADMREAGLSLEEIRELLETKHKARSGGAAAEAACQILSKHVAELNAKINVLSRLKEDLERTAAATGACNGCEQPDFPDHCDQCGRVAKADAQPRGMRVLWSLSRK